MKLVISFLLLSLVCNAQSFNEEQMYRKTGQALVKFYGYDSVANEISRRVQERYLPKEYKPYIPYFLLMHTMVIDKKIVYRKEW